MSRRDVKLTLRRPSPDGYSLSTSNHIALRNERRWGFTEECCGARSMVFRLTRAERKKRTSWFASSRHTS